MAKEPENQPAIILYQTEDGRTRIQCRFENETIWLSQALIAELFQKDVRTINEHLVNIYEEGELDREATIRKFRIVRFEGKREVTREVEHYNLDAILAVGFRVRSHLKDEGEALNVLQYYQRQLAEFIHAQMQAHHWEKASGYEVVVSKGFTTLKPLAFTEPADEAIHNHRLPVVDKSKIAQMVFGGFDRCLYPVQKFQSDTERVLSVILDREAVKWFKPGRGQFLIYYKWGSDRREYQPDFVGETSDAIYMLEPKARKDMDDGEVIAKKDSAVRWCQHATDHAAKNGGRSWTYLLIPHDAIAENMTLQGLAAQFAVS